MDRTFIKKKQDTNNKRIQSFTDYIHANLSQSKRVIKTYHNTHIKTCCVTLWKSHIFFFGLKFFFKLSNALKIFYIPSKYIRCSSLFCRFQFCSILFPSHPFVLLVHFIFLLIVRHASTHSDDL